MDETGDRVWHSSTGFKSKSQIHLDLWERAFFGATLWLTDDLVHDKGLSAEKEGKARHMYLSNLADTGHLIRQ